MGGSEQPLLLFLDNEYMFMDLEQKLSKYFLKDWSRNLQKVRARREGTVEAPQGRGSGGSALGSARRGRPVTELRQVAPAAPGVPVLSQGKPAPWALALLSGARDNTALGFSFSSSQLGP